MSADDQEAQPAPSGASDPQPDDGSGHVTVWWRWYGEPNVPFHRYCVLYSSTDVDGGESDRYEPAFYFTKGLVRFVLQRTPLFVLLAAVILLVAAEYTPEMTGLGATVSGTQLAGHVPTVLAGIAWLVVLLALINQAGVLPDRDRFEGAVVYLTGLGLLSGVLLSVLAASTTPGGAVGNPATGETGSVVTLSGFLLMLFIGGHLVYDGMLRTENMFSRLHEKEPRVIGPSAHTPGDSEKAREDNAKEAYVSTFLDDFKNSLESRVELDGLPGGRTIQFRTARVFAVLFVAPFFVSGLVMTYGSLAAVASSLGANPATIIVGIITAALDVILVVVFFQFLVVITYFNRLLTEHSPENDGGGVGFTLQYRPHHADGYAGFRDLGRFATRVNTLLIVGGLYVAYRIYVGGLPALRAMESGAMEAQTMTWAFSYLGPLVAYGLAVVVWIYFSFWQIHKSMRRGREQAISAEIQEHEGRLPEEKLDLRQAPVWPLNVRLFTSLLVGDLLPVITLLPLL